MNQDIFKGKWHEIKGQIKAQWGKLTDDEISEVEGNHEKLRGLLQKHYGYTKDQIDEAMTKF